MTATPTRSTRIAVVTPRSQAVPQLADDILSGISIGLARVGVHDRALIEVHTAPALPSHSARTVSDLLDSRGADVLVMLAQPAATPALAPLVERARVPLLALDAGANVPRQGERSPYVFTQTLGLWQAAWAAGAWAARNAAMTAVVVGSFNDLGYDLAFAFEAGFKISGGSNVSAVMTDAPANPGRHDWLATLAALRRLDPDVVYLLERGDASRDFLRAYDGSARIMATQMVVETPARALDASLAGVISVASWASDRDSEHELTLRAGLGLGVGSQPSPFARLGFDAGMRLGTAMATDGPLLDTLAARNGGGRLPEHLSSAGTDAPESPLYVRQAHVGAAGIEQRWVADAPEARLRRASLAPLANALRSGWVYPYLAV